MDALFDVHRIWQVLLAAFIGGIIGLDRTAKYDVVGSTDFAGDLAAKYDTIVLPTGVGRETIVRGLDPQRHDKEWQWAFGVGEDGWTKLGAWVRNGGTLVAIGTAVETARELLDLPIEKVLPETRRRGGPGAQQAQAQQIPAAELTRRLREAFQSPAQLIELLVESVSKGGNLLMNVGPTARGTFDGRAKDRLEAFGRWMAVNGRSIYGATQAPDGFKAPANSLLTYNPTTNRLYLHLLAWAMGQVVLGAFADRGTPAARGSLRPGTALSCSSPPVWSAQHLSLHAPTARPS